MHKGLYWAQLILGIGIGLVIGSLVWIVSPHPGEAVTYSPGSGSGYYDTSDFQLDGPDFKHYSILTIDMAGSTKPANSTTQSDPAADSTNAVSPANTTVTDGTAPSATTAGSPTGSSPTVSSPQSSAPIPDTSQGITPAPKNSNSDAAPLSSPSAVQSHTPAKPGVPSKTSAGQTVPTQAPKGQSANTSNTGGTSNTGSTSSTGSINTTGHTSTTNPTGTTSPTNTTGKSSTTHNQTPAKQGALAPSPVTSAVTTAPTTAKTTSAKTTANPTASAGLEKPVLQLGKGDQIAFVIAHGESTERIAARLEALGFFRSKDFLHEMYTTHLDLQIKAGTHLIRKGSTIAEVIEDIIK